MKKMFGKVAALYAAFGAVFGTALAQSNHTGIDYATMGTDLLTEFKAVIGGVIVLFIAGLGWKLLRKTAKSAA